MANLFRYQEQRLKPTSLEADTFERVVKIKGAQTLRRHALENGLKYGAEWSEEQNLIADGLASLYGQKVVGDIDFLALNAEQILGKSIDKDTLQGVISKMEKSFECLLKESPPFLCDRDYAQLI